MNIVLIGATGYVGRALLEEALDRGHRVTAVARDTASLPVQAGLTAQPAEIDGGDPAAVAALVEGSEAVIARSTPAAGRTRTSAPTPSPVTRRSSPA